MLSEQVSDASASLVSSPVLTRSRCFTADRFDDYVLVLWCQSVSSNHHISLPQRASCRSSFCYLAHAPDSVLYPNQTRSPSSALLPGEGSPTKINYRKSWYPKQICIHIEGISVAFLDIKPFHSSRTRCWSMWRACCAFPASRIGTIRSSLRRRRQWVSNLNALGLDRPALWVHITTPGYAGFSPCKPFWAPIFDPQPFVCWNMFSTSIELHGVFFGAKGSHQEESADVGYEALAFRPGGAGGGEDGCTHEGALLGSVLLPMCEPW